MITKGVNGQPKYVAIGDVLQREERSDSVHIVRPAKRGRPLKTEEQKRETVQKRLALQKTRALDGKKADAASKVVKGVDRIFSSALSLHKKNGVDFVLYARYNDGSKFVHKSMHTVPHDEISSRVQGNHASMSKEFFELSLCQTGSCASSVRGQLHAAGAPQMPAYQATPFGGVDAVAGWGNVQPYNTPYTSYVDAPASEKNYSQGKPQRACAFTGCAQATTFECALCREPRCAAHLLLGGDVGDMYTCGHHPVDGVAFPHGLLSDPDELSSSVSELLSESLSHLGYLPDGLSMVEGACHYDMSLQCSLEQLCNFDSPTQNEAATTEHPPPAAAAPVCAGNTIGDECSLIVEVQVGDTSATPDEKRPRAEGSSVPDLRDCKSAPPSAAPDPPNEPTRPNRRNTAASRVLDLLGKGFPWKKHTV